MVHKKFIYKFLLKSRYKSYGTVILLILFLMSSTKEYRKYLEIYLNVQLFENESVSFDHDVKIESICN